MVPLHLLEIRTIHRTSLSLLNLQGNLSLPAMIQNDLVQL